MRKKSVKKPVKPETRKDRTPNERQKQFISTITDYFAQYIAEHAANANQFFGASPLSQNHRSAWEDCQNKGKFPMLSSILLWMELSHSHIKVLWNEPGVAQTLTDDFFLQPPFCDIWAYELSQPVHQVAQKFSMCDSTICSYKPKIDPETQELVQRYPTDFFYISRILSELDVTLIIEPDPVVEQNVELLDCQKN